MLLFYIIEEPAQHENKLLKQLEKAIKKKNHNAICDTFLNLGKWSFRNKMEEKSVEYFNNVLKYLPEIDNKSLESECVGYLAALDITQDDLTKEETFEKAITLAKEEGNLRLEALHLNNFGVYFFNKNNLSKARKLIETSVDILKTSDNLEAKYLSKLNLGLILYRKNELKFTKAL